MVCMNGLDAVAEEEARLEFRISNQIWESSHSYLVLFSTYVVGSSIIRFLTGWFYESFPQPNSRK